MQRSWGQGNLMCLYGEAEGSANGSVADRARKVRESAQGMAALRDVSVPVTAFPCMWPGTQRTVGAVAGILSALG